MSGVGNDIFLLLLKGNVEQKLVLWFVLLSFDDKLIWFDLARDCRTACKGWPSLECHYSAVVLSLILAANPWILWGRLKPSVIG